MSGSSHCWLLLTITNLFVAILREYQTFCQPMQSSMQHISTKLTAPEQAVALHGKSIALPPR